MIKINILLIEDNRGDARLITELLKDVTLFRSSVTKAKTMSGALEVLSTSSFEIILLDLSLPDSSGMETFASIRRVCGNTPVIVISGLSDETVVLEMINRGAQDFLNKSILSSQLLEKSIQHSIERNRIHRELQQSEEKYRLLFDKMINGFALHEIICNAEGKPVDYRFLEANESFGRMTKIDVHSIIGKTVREVLPETEQYWIDTYGEVALTGKSIKFTNYSGVLNKYFSIIAFSPQPNRFATVFEDITQLRHDEKKIETLLRMNRVLSNINQLIVRTKEIDTVFRNACSILVRDGGFVMAWIGIVNESTRMLDVVADAGITDDYLKKINIDLNDPIRSSGPTGRTVKKGIHHFIRDIETEPMMKPWRADAIRLGYKSSAAFPLKEKEKVVGAFTLYAPEVNFFTEEELHLLDELAMDISFAIEVSELERDRQNKYLALQESEYFFKESQRAAFVGSYKFDLATGIWESSEVMDEILGIDKSYDRSFQGWENIIYPDDRTMVKAYLSEEVIGQRKPFQKEYRIVRKSDGETRWLVDTGQFTFASEGKMEFFIGTIQDITERKVIEQTLLERENQYHFLADNISDVLWMLDLQTMRITYCSPSIKKLRGFTVDEVLGQTIEQMMTPASFGLLKKILPERLQDFLEGKPGAASSQIEIEQVCKNGSTVWTGITTTFIKDENGGVSVIGMSRDISEQKRSEEKLQESEERLRLSLAAAKQGLYDLDIETGKAVVNDEYATMIGYDPKTFVETNEFWTERLHPDDRERTAKTYTDYISGAIDEYRVEFRSATRQGEWKWILSVGKIIEYTKEGKPSRMMGTHTDIDMMKKAEEVWLLQTTALESAFNGVVITDIHGVIVWANKAFTRITGYTVQEAIGAKPSLLKSGVQPPDFYKEMWNTILSGNTWRGNVVNRRKDGTLYDDEMTITPVRNVHKTITHFIAVKQDATERNRAIEKIEEQAMLLAQAHDAIILRDMDHRITYWNKGAENIYGWTFNEVFGKDARDVLFHNHGQYDKYFQELFTSGTFSGEVAHFTKERKEIIVEVRLSLIYDKKGNRKGILSINSDITGRKTLESQILRTQRLNSLGTLAGGIAHDLNNVLAPILLSIEILKRMYPQEGAEKLIGAIESSARRGSDVVKQILSFARGMESKKTVMQPRHLIAEIVSVFKETFPRSITIVNNVPKNIRTILGDPTHFHQLIMNLGVNARDAMPDGGTLTVGAENVEIDEEYCRTNINAHPGHFVKFIVADTGHGMTPEIIDHIYEPFFTTKEIGKGTGLGLSTVHTIVKSHNGFIEIQSEPGKGSVFTVYLPVSEEGSIEAEEPNQLNQLKGNGELILVVDDEASVREVTSQTLEAFGYRVVTAVEGTDAMSKYTSHAEDIALVITDMMMPVMDGYQLIAELRKIDPPVKIIASSGLIDTSRSSENEEKRIDASLHKPYTAEQLLLVVKETLQKKV